MGRAAAVRRVRALRPHPRQRGPGPLPALRGLWGRRERRH